MESLDYYRKEAKKYSLLSKDEEQKLGREKDLGNLEARDILINSNFGLVLKEAKKFRWRGLSYDELVQEGNCGLIKAVKRYDPSRDTKFSTYAISYIKGFISNALIEKSRTIRISSKKHHKLSRIHIMESRGNNIETISQEMGEDIDSIKRLINVNAISSLDYNNSNSWETILDSTPDNTYNPGETQNFLRHDLISIFDKELTPREADILKKRSGLNEDNFKYSQEELGIQYGITKERVRQIQDRVVEKLRDVKEIKELEYLVRS
ncbi:sigma-70 family RNA polymerase sigma factor [Candidatus Pacearchaeota archaeon]|nr:sigma-70 family RNA polymerase sigma factor [Candidatus Pacearchaeota archaeon]